MPITRSQTRSGKPASNTSLKTISKTRSKETFRLLDLPPELRNEIYKDCIQNSAMWKKNGTALLRVNRQVSAEAGSLMLRSQTIHLEWSYGIRMDRFNGENHFFNEDEAIRLPAYIFKGPSIKYVGNITITIDLSCRRVKKPIMSLMTLTEFANLLQHRPVGPKIHVLKLESHLDFKSTEKILTKVLSIFKNMPGFQTMLFEHESNNTKVLELAESIWRSSLPEGSNHKGHKE